MASFTSGTHSHVVSAYQVLRDDAAQREKAGDDGLGIWKALLYIEQGMQSILTYVACPSQTSSQS